MKRYSTFRGTPSASVSSLSAVWSGSCWLPFSFVLSAFSWRISSIIYYCECYNDCNTSMKVLTLSVGTLVWGWGSTPVLLVPSVWLSCCWWGVVGLDFACEGTTLIFRVVLDFGGIVYEGLCFLFFFFAPVCFLTPQWSRQFNVGFFFVYCVLGWAASCGNGPECFWVRELGPVQL